MELKVGILYLALHNQLKKKFGVNHIMNRKELDGKLGWEFKVPRSIRAIALDEMIKMKLIEKLDRDRVKILNIDIDIESCEGRNKLCKMAGIF